MKDWRELGYVPDSDDDEEEFTYPALSSNGKAENKNTPPSGGHNGSKNQSELIQLLDSREDVAQSVAEQLNRSITQGLETIHEVLAETIVREVKEFEEDDSPLSSLPTSLGSSPRLVADLISDDQGPLHHAQDSMPTTQPDVDISNFGMRRNFRTRNPIQLHPYMLEDAKYRTLMQARGLKPLYLPRPNEGFAQQLDKDDSQATDHVVSSPPKEMQSFEIPSSPITNSEQEDESQSPVQGLRRAAVLPAHDNEDDLPDIFDILQEANIVPKRPNKLKTDRSREPRVDPIRRQQPQQSNTNSHDFGAGPVQQDIFRVPPSPPGSSSPVGALTTRRRRRNRGLSHGKTPPGLPTPVLSSAVMASKRSRGGYASSISMTSTESESDDPSPEVVQEPTQNIQHMTRRIRGVLPASWLRLDLKKQTNHKHSGRSNLSPAKTAVDKGIAKHVTTLPATQRTVPGEPRHVSLLGFASEEESDESEESATNRYDQPSKSGYGPAIEQDPAPRLVSNYSLPSHQEEAEEDNELDQMLPQQSRGWTTARRSSKKSQLQQQKLFDAWDDSHDYSTASRRSYQQQAIPDGGRTKAKPSRRDRNSKKPKRTSVAAAMNVFEAPAFNTAQTQSLPEFVKIAARQARRRTRPVALPASQKFFQFATREDTEEVSEAVKKWSLSSNKQQRMAKSATTRSDISPGLRDAQSNWASAQHQSPTHTAQRPISADLQGLKRSTDALLQKMSNQIAPENNIQINASHSDMAPRQQTRKEDYKSSAVLSYLFPRRNRSGKGQLLTRIGGQRPAQLEGMQHVNMSNSVSMPQRIPEKGRSVPDFVVAKLGVQRRTQIGDAADNLAIVQPVPVERRPRKGVPKSFKTTSLPFDNAASPTKATCDESNICPVLSPAVKEQSAVVDDTFGLHASRLIDIARKHMNRVSPFASDTIFCNNLIADGVLGTVVARFENPHSDILGDPKAVAHVRVLSTGGRTELLGQYNFEAQEILDECHRSILDTVGSWDCASTEPILALNDIVTYTEQALCFPDEASLSQQLVTTTSHRSPWPISSSSHYQVPGQASFSENTTQSRRWSFINRSLNFVKQSHEIRTSTPSDYTAKNYSRFLSLLMVHNLQLSGLATQLPSLSSQVKDVHRELMRKALSITLEWNNLNARLLPEIERQQHPTSHMSILIFDKESVEAVAMLVAWQSCKHIYGGEASENFYQAVAGGVNLRPSTDPVCDLSKLVTAVSYAVRFTTLEPMGSSSTNPNKLLSSVGGWSCLLPLMSRFVSFIRSSFQLQLDLPSRLYLKDLMSFIVRLVDYWKWEPTPALAKTLLEIYSLNELIPFDFGGDVAAIFYDLNVIDHVSDHQKNDYDQFLRLVHKAIELLQFRGQDEVTNNATTVAKDIRGLVYSLMPNNARLYDAREELQAEQFLALKNHFALFVTLYRSSPEGCGPRIQQFEQQVDLEYSHFVVCKIPLFVWKILACHEVKKQIIDHRCLQEIGGWLKTIFVQLEKRDRTGQVDTRLLYEEIFGALILVLDMCPSKRAASDLLLPATENIRGAIPPVRNFGGSVTKAALGMFSSYIRLSCDELDNSGMIAAVLSLVKNSFQAVIQDKHSRNDLLQRACSTWFANAYSMVKALKKTWYDFIEPRSSLSIDQLINEENDHYREIAKQFFFSELIETEKDSIFLEYRPQLFESWIVGLVSAPRDNTSTKCLTMQILRYGGESLQLASLADHVKLSTKNTEDYRLFILQHIIRNMYGQQGDPESEWLAGGLDEGDMLELLRSMTTTMKQVWKELQPNPTAQNAYTAFIQAIINELEIYPLSGFKLDPWFTNSKEFPRPSQTFDAMFKCRFGHEGGDITKSSIVTLRVKCIEALKFDKRDVLSEELNRVFCCTDSSRVNYINEDGSMNFCGKNAVPQYSIDIAKQTQFIKVVLPVYLQQAAMSEMNASAIKPVIDSLKYITQNIVYRIDNLELRHVSSFALATFHCLAATRNTLDRAGNKLTHAIPVLYRYAQAAVQVIWSLFESFDLKITEKDHETFVTDVLGIATHAGNLLRALSGSRNQNWQHVDMQATEVHQEIEKQILELDELACKFSSVCEIVDQEIDQEAGTRLTSRESELRNFASQDLQEGLASMGHVKTATIDEAQVKLSVLEYIEVVRSLRFFPEQDEGFDYDEIEMW